MPKADSPGRRRPHGFGGRPGRAGGPVIAGLLVFAFVGGLGVLAALVPVGHGFVPKGGGWFTPAAAGGVFTLHPLLIAVPWAACFVLGLLDWRRPWRVAHLDLLALAGFWPVAMLLSDDASQAGLWLAAVCLGWLFARMLGAALGTWPAPELRPSIGARWLGPDQARHHGRARLTGPAHERRDRHPRTDARRRAAQCDGSRRQRLDLVAVHGRRLEYPRLACIHRVRATRRGEFEPARKAEFPTARIRAHAPAGHGHRPSRRSVP